ncbi:MAG: UBA/THIF-type binding protein [Thermoleophilia bacterium]|nr:UBA/THIF-type binding protein [Thermoleophilia bacterium]
MANRGERILPCPGIETFLDSHDDLYLLPIAGRDQLCVKAPVGRWVWSTLNGASVDEMPIEVATEVAGALDWLEAETYVRRESSVRSPETDRWDRQVQWFAQETGEGPARQHRLLDATVLVLGVGGLGSAVADLLARAGIGTLVLVDHDVVDEANLPRQQLYSLRDVGRAKVDAAAERLRSVAPATRVRQSHQEVRSAVDVAALLIEHDPQLVVCAADRPPIAIKTWVEDAASELGVAVMHGGHRPPLVYAGPFFVPGVSCCYACFSSARTRPGTEQLERELASARDANPPQLPAVGWGDAAAASFIVGQAVQWLGGVADSALLGRELELDLRTLESRWVDGPTQPMCLRCEGIATSSLRER